MMDSYCWLLFCCYFSLAGIVYSIVYWIEVVLGLPQQESNATVAVAPMDESYENLRRLVEQIIEQVFKIPELLDYSGVPGRARAHAPEFEPKKYEELLATAVLNRIVEKFEREQKLLQNRRDWADDPNGQSKLHSANSDCSSDEPRSESSFSAIQRRPMSLNVELAKQNLNIADTGLCSPTSDEEYLSDYIQNHRVPLPDLGAKNCDVQQNPDEEFQSLEANGHGHSGVGNDGEERDESWQNNWMFRKRDAVESLPTVANASIGMLVPSPTEDVKALIGDRTADEISDLSEAGSDSETELSDAENQLDIESKTLISESTEPTTEPLLEMRNIIFKSEQAVEGSLLTLHDVVSVEEKTLVQTAKEGDAKHHAPIIVDLVHKSIEVEQMPVPVAAPRKHSLVTSIAKFDTSEGSIAEREHMKWENVQDVPGNPYSPEALQKRLSTQSLPRDGELTRLANLSHGADMTESKQSPIASPVSIPNITRYGRDYYINDAKHAAGKTPDADEWQPIFPGSSCAANYNPVSAPLMCHFLPSTTIRPSFLSNDYNNNIVPYKAARYRIARRAYSMRSLCSWPSSMSSQNDTWSSADSSCEDSCPKRDIYGRLLTEARATSAFEADTLRGNLRRNCMCSRDGTDNFVVNPLFEDD